jgi:hypothetical protein
VIVGIGGEAGDIERDPALAELEATFQLAHRIILAARIGDGAAGSIDQRREQDLVGIGAPARL